jgi:hypothetical protein
MMKVVKQSLGRTLRVSVQFKIMRKATLLHSEYFAERSLENTVVLQVLCRN